MPRSLKVVLAAGLVAMMSAAAANAAPAARRAAPQPAPQSNTVPYSYQGYGLSAQCADRPFASGCDRRGTW